MGSVSEDLERQLAEAREAEARIEDEKRARKEKFKQEFLTHFNDLKAQGVDDNNAGITARRLVFRV